MCPASAISASEPGDEPADHLDDHEAAGQQRRDPDRPGVGVGRARDGALAMVVAVPVAVPVPPVRGGQAGSITRGPQRRGDERLEVLRVANGGHLGRLDRHAPAVRHRLVARQPVRHQRAEAVADEGVGVDRLRARARARAGSRTRAGSGSPRGSTSASAARSKRRTSSSRCSSVPRIQTGSVAPARSVSTGSAGSTGSTTSQSEPEVSQTKWS